MAHPLQSEAWGKFRQENGNLVSHVNDYQIIWSKLPKLPFYFGTLLKSQIPTDQDLDEFTKEGKKMGGIGIRIEPDIQTGTMPNRLVKGRRFFTPKTFWLDLSKSEEQLLKAMHPKARYNIGLAQRKGVEIKEDNASLDKFLDLMRETQSRQGFFAHNENYFRTMWKYLFPAGIAHLFTATYQNEVLAAWIIFKYRDKIYYPYGASTDRHKEVQARSLMLWETALWGKNQGCKIYDLWGVEEGKGFTDFKAKFSPQLVEFVGTYDLIINPVFYWLFRLSEEIRWLILGSLRRTPNIFKR